MQVVVRALLLTDIVDSTKLVESLGEERAAAVGAAHDTAARGLLPAWRGREIDKTDGFLMLFESARDAVGYALAYHRTLARLSGELRVTLTARAGIHLDKVILRETPQDEIALGAKPLEVEGLAKPLAARVMSLARGRQTLLTGSARGHLRGGHFEGIAPDGTAPDDVKLKFHGHWRLKGVADPVALFEIGVPGEAPFAPPDDASKAYRVVKVEDRWGPARDIPRVLPAERDVFVGREEELADLARRLDGAARLVTVLGTGGVGKTRLVTRYAWTWMGDYPGGVWSCSLSEARSLDGIAVAVASTLDVPLGKDPIGQLGHAIAARGRCLVILDNFEQVAEHAEATLGRWLERARDASFVVTSRERLRLPGEEVMVLEPLPVGGAAVELFMHRARAQRQDFALTRENRDDVEEVVRLLDGLPLAIELAAARIRVLSPQALLVRLKDRFALLTGVRGAGERQATLRAAIDWSWTMLEPWEHAALAQSSVFEGGFTLEAAEAVLDLSTWPGAPSAIDVVQALVDKSLLRTWTPERLDRRHAIEEPYFSLYVSIKDYAAEKLRSEGAIANGASGVGAEGAARERHGVYFASLGTDAAIAALRVTGGLARQRALELELDNLMAASRRAAARGAGRVASRTLRAAWGVLRHRGPSAAGIDLARPVVALDGLEPSDFGHAMLVLGEALRATGRVDEAEAKYMAALDAARTAGDRLLEGRTLVNLALVHGYRSARKEQREVLTAALDVAREIGDRGGEGVILTSLGIALGDEGRPDEARDMLERGRTIFREVGDREAESTAMGKLGSIATRAGQLEAGLALLHEAMAITREVGNRWSEGGARSNLAGALTIAGMHEEARRQYEEALVLVREVGYRPYECIILNNLGGVALSQDRPDEACEHNEAALAIARELGNRAEEAHALSNLGKAQLRTGSLEDARRNLEAALTLARVIDSPVHEGNTLGSLGALHAREGRLEASREAFDLGATILRKHGALTELGTLLAVRGRAELGAGDATGARATLAGLDELIAELGLDAASELGRHAGRLRADAAAGAGG